MDRSFEGNLPHFQAVIEKYEALFEELTHELHSVKSEHETVKSKLSAIIIENQELSKELQKVRSPNLAKSSENEEIIECLKKQIKNLLSEKEDVSKLWQNASKSVEILEGELRIYQSGSENVVPKKDLLKLISEKNNIQLASEKETIKNDMAQMADHYERTLKTKEVEKLTFQNRIKQFQTDLEDTQFTLKNIKEQLELEKEEKKAIERNLIQQKEEKEKILTKTFTDKLTDATSSYNEKISQLHKQLEFKDQLNKKWSVESKAIVENLEKLIANLKKELSRSKKENSKLRFELEYEQKKFEQYKSFLQIITKDVDKISNMAKENAESVVFDSKAFVK